MMVLRNPTASGSGRIGVPLKKPHHRRGQSNEAFEEPLRALEANLRQHDLRRGEGYIRGPVPGGPSLIRHGPLKLVISSAPSPAQLPRYAEELRSQGVNHVVRVCQPTYATAPLRGAGLHVHEMAFGDGDAPPPIVVARWLALLDEVFDLARGGRDARDEAVAVHCMAGMGRAPVLVALALIEAGAHPYEAVGTIRAQRRGAINARQMAFLEAYVPRSERRPSTPSRNHSPLGARARRHFHWIKRGSHRSGSQVSVEHR